MFNLVVSIDFNLMYEVCLKFLVFYEHLMFCLILCFVFGFIVEKAFEKK
jgi:hypothetical protein